MYFAIHMKNKETGAERVKRVEADNIDGTWGLCKGILHYGSKWTWTGTEPFKNIAGRAIHIGAGFYKLLPWQDVERPYFPPLDGEVTCHQCKKQECISRDKYQRNKRDFSVSSGRCPRLPDLRGFVDRSERDLYFNKFELIHAELGVSGLTLSLSRPNSKRTLKVYQTKSGYWYIKRKSEWGHPIKQRIIIPQVHCKEHIVSDMKKLHTDYLLFRCEVRDETI